jgi:hypothetical protein
LFDRFVIGERIEITLHEVAVKESCVGAKTVREWKIVKETEKSQQMKAGESTKRWRGGNDGKM